MSERRWIAVVGSVNADVAVWAPSLPREGETALGTSAALFPGGKGGNQAVQAARLGSRVRLVARVGRDPLGDLAVGGLEGAGVEVETIVRDPEAGTGVASVWIGEDGANRIVVVPQANSRLSPDDIDRARAAIEGAALLAVQLEIPLEAVEHAVGVAAGSGVPVLLNPAPARPLPPELLRRVTWLVPNEHEASALTGIPPEGVRRAASALRERGAACVVVTLGASGALVLSSEGEEHVPAFPVEHVVDTTAAGDAFCGALASRLADGAPLLAAVRFASAAAAVAVTRAGAQPSLGGRSEIEAVLRG